MTSQETLEFTADVKQVLALMTEAVYTKKEIFLRELISNASDALDSLRITALTHPEALDDGDSLEIGLSVESVARTLTIDDTGIGMTRDELVANIGTIARSGTNAARAQRQTSEASGDMIGRFGVGFYSAFMVADRVVVSTRRAGEASGWQWESSGDGTYTIRPIERQKRGTEVLLYLKRADEDKGIEDYTDPWILERVVKQHSDFIAYPIFLLGHHESEQRSADHASSLETTGQNNQERRIINSMKPVWEQRPGTLKIDDYADCYKRLFHEAIEPVETIHFEAEGATPYRALLFIPKGASRELYYSGSECGLRLYANRVLVADNCEDLLPRYLRFIRGVVDADVPLNISRQRVQEDLQLMRMRRHITRKVLAELSQVREKSRSRYVEFWRQFGRSVKEGVSSDYDNRALLTSLLLFESSSHPEVLTTLEEYTKRMRPQQEAIWYLTGDSMRAVEASPHLEAALARGDEVLYLTDRVDELLLQYLHEFDGHKLRSVAKGPGTFGTAADKEEARREIDVLQDEFKGVIASFEMALKQVIKRVCLTTRLTSSPACLVVDEHDYSPVLERALRLNDGASAQRRVLELNPKHPVILLIRDFYRRGAEPTLMDDAAQMLFGLGLLAEGSPLSDHTQFGRSALAVLERSLQGHETSIEASA